VSASAQAIANGRNWSTTVAGESHDYLRIRDWPLARGAMFSDREVQSAATVVVLGSKTAAQLFGPLDPVGATVRVKNIPFLVIAVLTSKGAGFGGNQDDRIVVPFTTAMKRITGDKYLRSINVQVGDAGRMASAQDQITRLLRQRHRLAAGREDDFNILNQKEIGDTVGSVSTTITLLLGAIAGIALVVGGIGIMNVMLVSVTERTREIGTRIAVGAQPGDIRLQFLVEAVTLSMLGGVIGIALGIGASRLVGVFTSLKAIPSAGSIAIAFAVSTVIGVFFGLYPAHKAAGLNPIEALRYE
jgi:putative ABC transport system permease protein